MDFGKVGTGTLAALGLGAVLGVVVPIVIALIWKFKKKEPITTILVGVGVFFVFALILEKLIQNALIVPTLMGLPDHPVSQFINARPILWAFVVGLFPGVFEETGRFVAFSTVLRNRRNRETSISYGLGHGLGEVIILVGVAFIEYFVFALMINMGTFQAMVDQVAAQAPEQVGTFSELATQLGSYSFGSLGLSMFERVFAVLFHIGASILVFYSLKDRKKIWLFPLAIILHTALDFIVGLTMANVVSLSTWQLEGIIAVFGILTFVGAYAILYKKDRVNGDEKI